MKNALIFAELLFTVAAAVLSPSANAGIGTPAETAAYAPPAGSETRKAIMDTLRLEMGRLSLVKNPKEIIFVVGHLKLHNGWGWFAVSPQTRDGTSHYEPLAGLLRQSNRGWQVMEWLPEWTSADEQADPHYTGWFKKLRTRFPAVPKDVFPQFQNEPGLAL